MGKGRASEVAAKVGAAGRDAMATDAAKAATTPQEVLIDGRFYDVTDFIKRHPGGRVITYYQGGDASQAFHEFHLRSERAYKMLKVLKSRPAEEPKDALLEDFNKLHADLKAEGFFDPSPLHVLYRIAEIVAMHAIGLWLVLSKGWLVAGLTLLGIAQGRCGWFMHEGGHYSAFGNVAVDRALQVFFYGFGCGMSAAFWRNQHNKHHATPQKLRHDVDLDTLPLVSFNTAVTKLHPKLVSKWWLKLQPYLFAPVTTTVVALGWQAYLHPRHSFRTKNFAELISMALRYVAWYAAFSTLGTSTMLWSYLYYVWVGGAYIFCNFAVSHTHKPVVGADENKDWVRYAAEHTTNIHDSWWCNWWMGYLNFQIEHHLFPSMPQFRHAQIAPRVAALFKKHGLTYDLQSYGHAVKLTFDNLANVGDDVWYG